MIDNARINIEKARLTGNGRTVDVMTRILHRLLNAFNKSRTLTEHTLEPPFSTIGLNVANNGYVRSVTADSSAATAGIKAGTTILKVDGQYIPQTSTAISKIVEYATTLPDESISVDTAEATRTERSDEEDADSEEEKEEEVEADSEAEAEAEAEAKAKAEAEAEAKAERNARNAVALRTLPAGLAYDWPALPEISPFTMHEYNDVKDKLATMETTIATDHAVLEKLSSEVYKLSDISGAKDLNAERLKLYAEVSERSAELHKELRSMVPAMNAQQVVNEELRAATEELRAECKALRTNQTTADEMFEAQLLNIKRKEEDEKKGGWLWSTVKAMVAMYIAKQGLSLGADAARRHLFPTIDEQAATAQRNYYTAATNAVAINNQQQPTYTSAPAVTNAVAINNQQQPTYTSALAVTNAASNNPFSSSLAPIDSNNGVNGVPRIQGGI